MSAYQKYLADHNASQIPSLKEFYREDFRIGVAVAPYWLNRPECDQVVRKHFNSLTAENNMKPVMLLDREATLASGSETRAVFHFQLADELMTYAAKNEMAVRFHTLVWHNQTPRWFFAEGWSDAEDAPLCSAETMTQRLRNSIADEMTYINTRWPGLVYAWDVVNEVIEPDHNAPNLFRTKSLWYEIMGESFVFTAFQEARKHCAQGQKLYYNDFNMAMPNKAPAVLALVKRLLAEGTIDGVGFQTHIGLDYPDLAYYEAMVKEYAALGLTIQATETDVRVNTADPAAQMKLAVRYRDYFAMMRRLRRAGADIDSITMWGMADDHSWLMGWNGPSYPLFFDGLMRPKPAFFGALLDESIPATMEEIDLPSTLPPESESFLVEPESPLAAFGMAQAAGVTVFPDRDGKPMLFTQVPQSWVCYSPGASAQPSSLAVTYACVCPATITVTVDDPTSEPIAALTCERCYQPCEAVLALPELPTAPQHIYLCFSAPCMRLNSIRLA